MAKTAFSRGDIAALAARMSLPNEVSHSPHSANAASAASAAATLSRSPSSPVAAKIMREVGISRRKISEAYGVALARTSIGS